MECWNQQKTQYSFSIEQKDAECIIVVMVIAEEAASAQSDRHPVPSLQVASHHSCSTVLLILLVFLALLRDHQAVNLQTSTGGQFGVRGTSIAVDGERQAVDARARDSEDTSVLVIAATQVEEDVFVNDILMGGEGTQASETFIRVKGHRRGDGAGCRQTCKPF